MMSGMGPVVLGCWAVFLKESLRVDKRRRGSLGTSLRLYGGLLSDRHFMVYALSGALIAGGMFAYLEGSPLVFIELNHVAPNHFGYFFGAIAVGLILASQLNGFLVRRIHPHNIFRVVLMVAATAGGGVFAAVQRGAGGVAGSPMPRLVLFDFPG